MSKVKTMDDAKVSRQDKNRRGVAKLRKTIKKDKKNVSLLKDVQESLEGMTPEGRKKMASSIDYVKEERKTPLKRKTGGAVPSEFKGFSKLPEAVQEKMNPSAAKKYKNGGAVLAGRGGSFKGTR